MSTEPKSASVGTTPAAPQTSTPVVATDTPGAPSIPTPPPGTPAQAPQQPQTPGGQTSTGTTALTSDGKPAENKAPETKPAEVVDFKPRLPDGFQVNEPAMSALKDIVTKDGVKPEVAQKIVDLHVKLEQERQQAEAERYTSQNQAWMSSAQSDKEYGGEKFNDNLAIARKAIERFGHDGLAERLGRILESTGLGNEPDFIRFMYRVGKGFADDSVAGTTSGAGAAATSGGVKRPEDMYPNTNFST